MNAGPVLLAIRSYFLILGSSLLATLVSISIGLSFRDKVVGNIVFFVLLTVGYHVIRSRKSYYSISEILGFILFILTSYLLLEISWSNPQFSTMLARVLSGPVERVGYYPPHGDTLMLVGVAMWAISVAAMLSASILLARVTTNFVSSLSGRFVANEER